MQNNGQVSDAFGQPRPDVLFTASTSGVKLFLTATGIHYQFTKIEGINFDVPHSRLLKNEIVKESQNQTTKTHHFSVELAGANPNPVLLTGREANYTENYYLPHCPNGITGIHGFEKIIYQNVYPNIDWVLYSKDGFMEYDFLVHPGGDPANIRLKIKDAGSVGITPEGGLLMKTGLGEVKEKAPVSFAGGKKVDTRLKQNNDGTIGFDVVKHNGEELIIDPVVSWATYYGGSKSDRGFATTTDGEGNVYLVGDTYSKAGIASDGFNNTLGAEGDAFVVKFDKNGTRVWATYYGGTQVDYAWGCAADGNGNIYISGSTCSPEGIAAGGFQNIYGGGGYLIYDAYLVKFNSSGGRVWGTYYGANSVDHGQSCAVDSKGDIYLAGYTKSTSNISSGGFQNSLAGNEDAFLAKFAGDGNLLWGTYYGGGGIDHANSCITDKSNNVYITGYTNSETAISSGGFQNTFGGGTYDAFMVKFNGTGSRVWATYYGGTGPEDGASCAIGSGGDIYLAGSTGSATGIASGGFQNNLGGENDAFLARFNSGGTRIWGTYYGGSEGESGKSCGTDVKGSVYLTGSTISASGIAAGGFQNELGGLNDAFLAKFDDAGNRLWATYYGGESDDFASAGSVDGEGNIYLVGTTISGQGVASGGFQNVIGGNYDAFLAKITEAPLPLSLLSFTAKRQGADAILNWQTADEMNTSKFILQRGSNGRDFINIGNIKAAGNSNLPRYYSFSDQKAPKNKTFYRLQIMDIDGKYTYSNMAVLSNTYNLPQFEIYPNPIKETLNIQLTGFGNRNPIQLNIYDLDGKLMVSQFANGNTSIVTLNLSVLARGVYLLWVGSGNQMKAQKIVLQ